MVNESTITFENVGFAYGEYRTARDNPDNDSDNGVRSVLRGVSFSAAQGELVAIMGNNGSGKSTIAMLLCAFLQPSAGNVTVFGENTQQCNKFELRQHIGLVMQNPDDQLVASIVENEIAFGPENLGLSIGECRQRVAWALSKVGLAGFEKREVNSLSGGQKQRVAIAGALAMQPEILVLDEATSMLDEPSRTKIAKLARRLADSGKTVLMITHSIEDAFVADRVLALQGGHIVVNAAPALAFADNMLQHKLGWPVKPLTKPCNSEGAINKISSINNVPPTKPQTVPLVELHDVSFSYYELVSPTSGASASLESPTYGTSASFTSPASGSSAPSSPAFSPPAFTLQDINLQVQSGELLAIVGPTGSGKSTLIKLMNGLLQPTKGVVAIEGEVLQGKHAANKARQQVGLVFQYPEHQMFTSSVYDEVAFGPRNLGLTPEETNSRVHEALEAVDLPFEIFAKRNPFALSGGEQRRVAIASVLSMRPTVLVLDEPCAGLDPAMHLRFLELLCQLNNAGQTIVMVSHDMSDVHAIATRVVEL